MRYFAGMIGLALVVAISIANAWSQEVAFQATRAAFRKPKSHEIKSIEKYCEAALATSSFPERDKLMRQAIQLMAADKRVEANVVLKQVNSLEQSDANLAAVICKPR
ncbi:MAG TPA: hypothetical protein VJV58_14435 [Bradyrhizobium sp.]|uniref:hypothetical protein n=1 Tax=Bradyrhizobium sp. TaxID=376 RepID=UPI002B48FE35|nr:hypothetical protein [Bradyrhizobium sp.]HKO72123.1 hypothetical protein [Bradyrhizobium sp.]